MEIVQLLYISCLIITTIKALVLGLKYPLRAQNFLVIYLIITLSLEVFGLIKTYLNQMDFAIFLNIYAVFCIIFFGFYFSNIFIGILKKITLVQASILLLYIFFYIDFLNQQFVPELGISLALFYIFNAILWFYQKLKLPVEDKIINDPNFWIFTALLLWSTYFIFRFTPMYLFDKEDPSLLQILIKIGFIVNAIMYFLFYIALVKYEILAKKVTK